MMCFGLWMLMIATGPVGDATDVGRESLDQWLTGAGWSWRELDLELDLTQTGSLTLTGHGRLERIGPASDRISFVLRKVMQVDSVEMDDELADFVQDVPVPFSENAHLLGVHCKESLATGDSVSLTFRAHSRGTSSQLVLQDEVAYASWVEAWYPVPVRDEDDPGFGAQARVKGKTTMRLPRGWRGLSNGARLRAESEPGIEVWRDETGVARSFVAAPFTVLEAGPPERRVGVYLLSPKPMNAQRQAQRLNQAIDVLSDRFGVYPYAGFAIAEVPDSIKGFGAASEQGFIVAKTYFFDAEDGNLPLFAHEAGHSWWGNTVSTDHLPGSRWCGESLAQYGAYLAIEAIEGVEAAKWFLHLSRPTYVENQSGRGYFEMIREGREVALSQSLKEPGAHQLSDAKGHWVYHMLRQRVGDAIFFDTLRSIVKAYRSEAISMDEIRAEFVKAAPDRELETFFRQWLDRKGAPVIDLDWWSDFEESDQDPIHRLSVHLTQRQAGLPYRLDLEIGVAMVDGRYEIFPVELTEAVETVELEVDALPVRLDLDPDGKLLLWRPFYGPRPQLTSE